MQKLNPWIRGKKSFLNDASIYIFQQCDKNLFLVCFYHWCTKNFGGRGSENKTVDKNLIQHKTLFLLLLMELLTRKEVGRGDRDEHFEMAFNKLLILGILYFVQGLPYGFQDKFIPVFLRSHGLTYTELSLMKLLLIPWLCKAAFAPVVDFVWTKQIWLLLSLFMLSVVSVVSAFIVPDNVATLSVILFLLNLFSATQDVSVDGLALQILRDEEIGNGNAAQVIGYKLGSLFGGGVLFWIQLHLGWCGLCVCMAIGYVGTSVIFIAAFPVVIEGVIKLICKSSENIDSQQFSSNVSKDLSEIHLKQYSKNSAEELLEKQKFLDSSTDKIFLDNATTRQRNKAGDGFQEGLVDYKHSTVDSISTLKWKDVLSQILLIPGTWPIATFVLIYKFVLVKIS